MQSKICGLYQYQYLSPSNKYLLLLESGFSVSRGHNIEKKLSGRVLFEISRKIRITIIVEWMVWMNFFIVIPWLSHKVVILRQTHTRALGPILKVTQKLFDDLFYNLGVWSTLSSYLIWLIAEALNKLKAIIHITTIMNVKSDSALQFGLLNIV